MWRSAVCITQINFWLFELFFLLIFLVFIIYIAFLGHRRFV